MKYAPFMNFSSKLVHPSHLQCLSVVPHHPCGEQQFGYTQSALYLAPQRRAPDDIGGPNRYVAVTFDDMEDLVPEFVKNISVNPRIKD